MRRALILVLVVLTCPLLAGSRPKARQHYEKGLQEFRQDDFKKAAKEFRKAAKEDPTWADVHFQLAMVYISLGEFKDAEKSNRRALELDASLNDARYWAGFFEDRRALSDCIRFAEDQDYAKAVDPLLRFLDKGGDLRRFHEVFRYSYLNPRPVMQALVRALAKKQDLERLEATIAEWDEVSSQQKGALFYPAFMALAEAGPSGSAASSWMDHWLAKAPQDILSALANRGWLLVQAGREDEARATYDQMLGALRSQPGLIIEAGDETRLFVEHFGGEFKEVEVVERTIPRYTDAARNAWVTGVVWFEAVVGVDGRLQEPRLVSQGLGYGLEESAIQDFAKWRFKPAQINGIPLSRRTVIEVSFDMR